MKIYLLLIPFIISCSTPRPNSRELAGLQPARILKVVSPQETDFAIDKSESIEFQINAYKWGTSPASERIASFSLVNGEGHFKDESVTSDEQGLIKNTFYHDGKIGETTVKVSVDRVEKIISFNMTRPSVFQGKYSLNKSNFNVDKKSVKATGNEVVNFTVQVNDNDGKSIDAYGLDVSLNGPESSFKMKEEGNGKYSYQEKIGTKAEEKLYSFSIAGVQSNNFINIESIPSIVFHGNYLRPEVLEDGRFRVNFFLRDQNSDVLNSIESINIEPAVFSKLGTTSKIIKDEKTNNFYFIYTPPKGKGETTLGIKLDGEAFWTTKAIAYDYDPIIVDKVIMDIEDTDIIPSGADHLILTIKVLDINGKLVKVAKDKKYFDLEVEGCAKVYDLEQNKENIFRARFVPSFKCEEATILLKRNGEILKEKKLTFNFKPKAEKVKLEVNFGGGATINDIEYFLIDSEGFNPRSGRSRGFGLTNEGINSIIPQGCAKDADENSCQAKRQFDFEYLDQAMQNIVLRVTDEPTDYTSHLMISMLYFFPRKVIPHIEYSEDRSQIIMTLPTDEKVYFDAETKLIVGGVLEEGPIDLGPSRHARRFPLIRYKGEGVLLRINGRGQDARLGQFNPARIGGDYGDTGGKDVLIYKYNKETAKNETCYGKKSDFWPQKDINPIPFLMENDEKLNAYLKAHCSFSL